MDSSERAHVDKEKMFFAHEVHDSDKWIQKAVRLLTDRVYVTIDLDIFDPGIMPSTGTPEPGGLGWHQVMKLLASVSVSKRIVGFDVVELCPSEHKAPDFLAAKLIYTLLSYIYANKPRSRPAAKSSRASSR
jgi:agmatinase